MEHDLKKIPGMEVLAGSSIVREQSFRCFDSKIMAFVGELSSALRSSSAAREYPDLASVAFFLRKRNLELWRARTPDAERRRGRGLCLHIAPSNIPLNFAFSWIFALLAGCSNIVRLPSRTFPESDAFISVLSGVLAEYDSLASSQAFVRYPRQDSITGALSEFADARLIWGGDATVKAIRALPAKPWCTDICFTDRWSCALFSTAAVSAASDEEISELARRFYNDTYLMDQQACSSPQLVVWDSPDAFPRKRFWKAVEAYAAKRYSIAAKSAVDKYTMLCEEAVIRKAAARFSRQGNLLTVESLSVLPDDPTALRGSCGYFFEYQTSSLDTFLKGLPRKVQTLSVYGYSPQTVADAVIKSGTNGIDRVVSVGRAIDIGPVWDGHDLIGELSRHLVSE